MKAIYGLIVSFYAFSFLHCEFLHFWHCWYKYFSMRNQLFWGYNMQCTKKNLLMILGMFHSPWVNSFFRDDSVILHESYNMIHIGYDIPGSIQSLKLWNWKSSNGSLTNLKNNTPSHINNDLRSSGELTPVWDSMLKESNSSPILRQLISDM